MYRVELTDQKIIDIFKNAWDQNIKPTLQGNIISLKESKILWNKHFGCTMIDDEFSFLFCAAEFQSEKEFMLFALKWS